ncbi:DNA-directed RNA polymerases 39 kda [Cyclospora cayetanensis]|uniref:DNA-directed RNA polymerases 39 kDa n=1 Tax=Cyclospora cayetanensis TaxID=88456 RepID=A0A1D3CXP3_9EIME|nr:DNA-directed RNA polymerases 39 kda [Cyclospora cayetanensis]
MSNPQEGECGRAPGDSGPRGGPSEGALAGPSRGSAALSGEDLSTAYNLGLRNNSELTQQLLLDQASLKPSANGCGSG